MRKQKKIMAVFSVQDLQREGQLHRIAELFNIMAMKACISRQEEYF